MSSTKPTIVIIHGGWHQPVSYQKLRFALETAGFEVHVPAMPSMNQTRPPDSGLKEDSAFIRGAVEKLLDEGERVVVLMHSYGGHVGSNALAGLGLETRASKSLPGGIKHLIYIAATAMPAHTSMMTKVREFNHEHLMPQAFDFAPDGTVLSRYPKLLLVSPPEGDDGADREAEAYIATFKRWNGDCMYQDSEYAAWREMPVTYILCKADMTLPADYQWSMVAGLREAGRDVEVVELDAAHCPNLTATGEVVAVVERVAGM